MESVLRALVFLIAAYGPLALGEAAGSSAGTLDFSTIAGVGVQDNGRVKPLSTYAREVVAGITGRGSFRVRDAKSAGKVPGGDPVAVLFSWTFEPDQWRNVPFVRINYRPLKDGIGLTPEQTYFSLEELASNGALLGLRRKADAGIGRDLPAKDRRLLQEARKVGGKVDLAQRIMQGYGIPIVPSPKSYAEPWLVWPEVMDGHGRAVEAGALEQWDRLGQAFRARDAAAIGAASVQLAGTLRELTQAVSGPEVDGQFRKLSWEGHYNRLKPFRIACVFYALGLIILLVSLSFQDNRALYWAGLVVLLVGVVAQLYGFTLRTLITGRAPVANMYESMMFMGFMLAAFALGFEVAYRSRVFALAASALTIVLLILADQLPLDRGLDPLLPVLRSNFWLTLHVLSSMAAYAAFTLSMGLAHINLGLCFFAPQKKETLRKMTLFLYRALCLGFLLMTVGTILGAWWAGDAWGRYWGWDPKETWSLICILGYGILLHGRIAGFWGPYGLAVGTVIAYALVGMCYYGVNFILGTGLHTYGFGDGGIQFATGYAAVEAAVVAAACYGRYVRQPARERQIGGNG